jgi:hypothetical protein
VGDALLARGIVARRRLRNSLDLAGDGIEPLVDVGDVAARGTRNGRIAVELSQSFSDMPARRAAASALSRTDGSMPSTLHDTREFMLLSGFDSGAHPGACSLPARPDREKIQFRAGRLPQTPTFSPQGK